jgi:hypothetical protein
VLDKLQTLHTDILAMLDELERVASAPVPDTAELASVRHKLTRASRGRTMLLESAYPRLDAGATAAEKALVDRLRTDGKEQLISSAEHIGTWSMRQITAQWNAYCTASRRMRAIMRARIEEERKLYPLLDRARLTSHAPVASTYSPTPIAGA